MKVLLVSVPGYHATNDQVFPLGFGYLIATAREQGHEVKAINYVKDEHVWRTLMNFIECFNPDAVGFNCTTFTRDSVRYWALEVKKRFPHIKLMAGGVHASYLYHHLLNRYGIDYVVIGEGEITFPKLLNTLENGRDLYDVKGLAFKDGDHIVFNERRDFIEDLDTLPPPDHSFARSLINGTRMGWTITSRGCPARCRFCCTTNYWGHRVRLHSPKRVVDDMERMVEGFGVYKIFFHDDTFNIRIDRVLEICKEILNRKLTVEWGVSCRVHPVSSEMLEAMIEAGCRHICWGVETGSPEIAQWMHKKITLQQVREAYALCEPYSRKGLLSTGAFMIVGLPGETYRTIQETLEFMNSLYLTDDPSPSILYVLPGTELWDEQRYLDESRWMVPGIPYANEIGGPSMEELQSWFHAVARSGKRIPFNQDKHFWNNIIRGVVPIPDCPTGLE